ncbi:hypothetical protein GFC01_14330 [Desulfofundulus thermobenzoicus]|uniref:Methyl-accepting transducer domain-containing protein n=1 Tax=Desulfofundulus thermobenzoicus TaxID=29376 RepID=A0A6N7IV45_9FIRM|nr:methyl-accepting chemotaxis protein [Desulfofundulus thermobenzoicus]MQL53413.1 hypothetical protein [Desulfofundulus thermobenzoicus]
MFDKIFKKQDFVSAAVPPVESTETESPTVMNEYAMLLRRDPLERAVDAAEIVYDLMGGNSAVCVTDTDKFLWSRDGKEFKLGRKPGDSVKKGIVIYEALTSGKRVAMEVPKERSLCGMSYVSTAIPVMDNGKIVGVVSLGSPITRQEKLRRIAADFVSSIEQANIAVENVARSAAGLAGAASALVDYSTDIQSGAAVLEEAVELIREVADQTHLLGLNAAIEAARAGEHGRGFTVVANEVRRLATQVKQSVKDMTEKLQKIQAVIDSSLEKINGLNELSQEQAASAEEISATVDQLVESAREIDRIAREIWL